MSPSGNVYLFLPSQGQGRTVRRLRTAEGPPAITLRGTFEPAGWRTHPMASPGELHSDTDLDCILAPGGGVRSVTKAPLSEFTLPDRTIREGTRVPALRGPGSTGVSDITEPVRRSEGEDCASRPAKASRIRIGCSRTRGRLTAPHNGCGVWPAAHILGR